MNNSLNVKFLLKKDNLKKCFETIIYIYFKMSSILNANYILRGRKYIKKSKWYLFTHYKKLKRYLFREWRVYLWNDPLWAWLLQSPDTKVTQMEMCIWIFFFFSSSFFFFLNNSFHLLYVMLWDRFRILSGFMSALKTALVFKTTTLSWDAHVSLYFRESRQDIVMRWEIKPFIQVFEPRFR